MRHYVIHILVALLLALASTVTASYSAAREAYRDGFYDVAAAQLERVLAEEPAHPRRTRIMLMLGRCYFELGLSSNSLVWLQQIRADAAMPDVYAEAQFLAGRTYEARGDTPKALFAYEAAGSIRPPSEYSALATLAAARTYLVRREVARARDALTNMPELADAGYSPAEPLFWRAQCDMAEEHFSDARDALVSALELETNAYLRSYLHASLAMAQWQLGRTNTAVRLCDGLTRTTMPAHVRAIAAWYQARHALDIGATNTAIQRLTALLSMRGAQNERGTRYTFYTTAGFPYADGLLALGQLAWSRGEVQAAESWFGRCRREFTTAPTEPAAAFGAALCASAQGDVTTATQIFHRLSLAEDIDIRAASLLELGDVARAANELEEALERYTAAGVAASNRPAAVEARLRVAVVHCDRGNPALALKQLNQLTNVYSPSVLQDVWLWRAWCLLEQGLHDDARAVMQRALAAFPNGHHAPAMTMYLARIAYQQGDYAQAQQLFEAVATNAQDAARAEQAAYELGWVLLLDGRQEEAIAQFARFATAYPDSLLCDDVEYYLGETFFDMVDYTRAYSAFAHVAETYPNGPFAAPSAYWAAESAIRLGDYALCTNVLERYAPRLAASEYAGRALLCAAEAYYQLGAFDAARAACERVRASATSSYLAVEAALQLSDCAMAVSNWSTAIELLTGLTDDPLAINRARALVARGEARAGAGDLRGALTDWLQVIYDHREHVAMRQRAVALAAAAYETQQQPDMAARVRRLGADAHLATDNGTLMPSPADAPGAAP